MTPFGLDVVPDVYSTKAGVVGRTLRLMLCDFAGLGVAEPDPGAQSRQLRPH